MKNDMNQNNQVYRILISWLGFTDLKSITEKKEDQGPLLRLLDDLLENKFFPDKIILLYDQLDQDKGLFNQYITRVEKYLSQFNLKFSLDYETLLFQKGTRTYENLAKKQLEILRKRLSQVITENSIDTPVQLIFNLSSGMPQMMVASFFCGTILQDELYHLGFKENLYFESSREVGVQLISNEISAGISLAGFRNVMHNLYLPEDVTYIESEAYEFALTKLARTTDKQMKKLVEEIKNYASMYDLLSDSPILILGETGTGKELVAHAIHQECRKKGSFIALNVAAIPEALLESEIFGYAKGAFTGAVKDKPGLFELAENGTLFLDEIGDMPQHLQTKLLRILQDRRVRPVGSPVEKIVENITIIAATNANIKERINQNQFRSDLL